MATSDQIKQAIQTNFWGVIKAVGPDYAETRFFFALTASIVSGVALFTHYISGQEWVTIQSAILALYTTHSVLDDKIRDC